MKKILLFDRLVEEFINEKYIDEVLNARKEYQELTGIIKDDFPIFIERLDQFVEWYILEYELKSQELSPLDYFYETNIGKLSTNEIDEILSLKNNILSIYQLKNIKKDLLILKDLVRGETYKVFDSSLAYTKILQKGDLISTRIYKYNGKYYIMRGVLSHPEKSFSYIKKKINYLKYFDIDYIKSFIMRLSLMRLKVEEYSYIPINKIYNDKPVVNF